MRSSRSSPPAPSQSQRRQLADFWHRRRARILATAFLAVLIDYAGGRMLQYNLADVESPIALIGLAFLFAGGAALAWAAGSQCDPIQSIRQSPRNLISDARYLGLLLVALGLSLTIDDPKNICLLLGPVILLELVRLRRADLSAHPNHTKQPADRRAPQAVPSWLTVAAKNLRIERQQITSSLGPLLMVPVVTLVVILYAWPFNSLAFHETWEIWCLVLSFAGLGIRMLASGQTPEPRSRSNNFVRVESLNTTGIFSVVRHPRPVGDYFIGLGVVLIPFVWWMPVAYSLIFYWYYSRIIAAEDNRLRREFGERFIQWAVATPALIPRFWRRPAPPRSPFWPSATYGFSFRTALKFEYAGIFLVIALHSSVEWLEHLILDRRVMLELFWIVLALVGLAACLLVRYLAKHTRVLNVPAR
jgi:protein-S-isoprenylcysteine O-methyltransferase Ste14